MHKRHGLPRLLLALNWLALLAAFAWTCRTQGNALWWLGLDWSGWLTEFAALFELGSVPAGSIWLMWLMLSVLWPAVARVSRQPPSAAGVASVEPAVGPAAPPLAPDSSLMQTRPELRDKILKLHQSLEKL